MVVLEDYDAIKIRDISGSYKFFIPMMSANDVILADLATEINGSYGRLQYDHEAYMSYSGVQKHMNPMGKWMAVITAEKV